jgi:MFS transporter, DHA2 family, multidrug resistance protein
MNSKRFIVVVTIILAAVMELIDTTIVNVALNQMAGALGATIEDVAWVITSYAIANVIIIPMTGFLAEYFGRKNYYLVSIIIFTVASYFCGTSNDLWTLVFWRFLQGIGGGALLSTSQSILYDNFPPEQRGVASGIFGMGVILGPTLGPTIGGLIVEHYHWSQIFFVNIPIGILAAISTILFIDQKEGEGKRKAEIKIDYLGIVLLIIGIGSLQFLLEKGESQDWFESPMIVTLTLTAAVGLVGFIWWELYTKQPVVNLRVMKHGTLALTTLFSFIAGLGMFTSIFIYPVLVQRINGFTPTMTGLSLLWPTLAGIFMMPVLGKRLSAGASPLPFIIIGMLLMILFGYFAGSFTADASQWQWFPVQLLRVFGISMLQLPLINQAVAGLPTKDFPAGIAINNMIRQLGGAFGIALANNYVIRQYAQHRSDLVANTDITNPLFMERVNTIKAGFISRSGDVALATQQAYRQIELTIDRQSYLLAYLDTFRVVSFFFIAIFPLIYFLRRKKPSSQELAQQAQAVSDAAH